jgi:hypothetical protein
MSTPNHFYLIDRFSQPKHVDCLYDGLLPRTGLGILWGQTQAGKSLFVMRLAASLATGAPLVLSTSDPQEGAPKYRGATLYFIGEGESGFSGRISAAEEALGDYISNLPEGMLHLPIVPIGIGYQKLEFAEQLDGILEAVGRKVEEYRAAGLAVRLIVFDTLVACFSINEENSNSEMERIVSAMRAFSHAFDCLVLAVAHPSKFRRDRESDIRGAGAPKNAADVILHLRAVNASPQRVLTINKLRDGGTANRTFSFRLEIFTGLPALIPDTNQIKSSSMNKKKSDTQLPLGQQAILEAIKASSQEELDRSSIQAFVIAAREKECAAKETKVPKKSDMERIVNRNLKKLLAAGIIVAQSHDHYRLADTAAPSTDTETNALTVTASNDEGSSIAAEEIVPEAANTPAQEVNAVNTNRSAMSSEEIEYYAGAMKIVSMLKGNIFAPPLSVRKHE